MYLAHFLLRLFMPALLLLCGAIGHAAPENRLYVGHFSKSERSGWQEKVFAGENAYQFINDSARNQQVLRVHSDKSASGWFKTQRIDLQKTPYLHWSWKSEQLYVGLDEQSKQGDDYIARIYIVIDGGMFFWNTRALNYVWSSNSAKERVWANPYTSNALMVAVESGPSHLNQWVSYRRNVAQDIQQLLGKSLRYIDAIAIMTDSDNGQQQATTYYGDIYFSALPE